MQNQILFFRIFNEIILFLGRFFLQKVLFLGQFFLFFLKSLFYSFSLISQRKKIWEQIHFIGSKSVFVICLTGLFTGMVLGMQGYYTLVKFASEGMLGVAVSLSLVRELGPVLSAIMIVARAGSAIASEIGIMRISEQIDALDTMDINPIRYLVSPKIVAAVICFPILNAIFNIVGIIGGYLTGCLLLGVSSNIYFLRIEQGVLSQDINGGLIKSLLFGIVVISICSFYGYYTHKQGQENFGAKGVSNSTTQAVVLSCVAILIVDYLITSFLM